jgi:DNA-binding NarL/FixJ family response regulator
MMYDGAAGTASRQVRVMVVDDLASFRRVARAVIDATAGFEAVGDAASGPEALALAEELHPDLVLLDVRMPEMGGIEAASLLHQAHPHAAIVLISAEELPNPVPVLASCGAIAFVPKREFGTTVLRRLWTGRLPLAGPDD